MSEGTSTGEYFCAIVSVTASYLGLILEEIFRCKNNGDNRGGTIQPNNSSQSVIELQPLSQRRTNAVMNNNWMPTEENNQPNPAPDDSRSPLQTFLEIVPYLFDFFACGCDFVNQITEPSEEVTKNKLEVIFVGINYVFLSGITVILAYKGKTKIADVLLTLRGVASLIYFINNNVDKGFGKEVTAQIRTAENYALSGADILSLLDVFEGFADTPPGRVIWGVRLVLDTGVPSSQIFRISCYQDAKPF